MSSPPGTRPSGIHNEQEAARAVQEMFGRIAPRYDLLNRLLSLTLDRVWRRRTARAMADLLRSKESCALDLCCGTGDLALELAQVSNGTVVGGDFAHPMLVRAWQKSRAAGNNKAIYWIESDALRMPFPDGRFDVVTAAFGFRNLANYRKGLEEIYRLLRPGGRVGILEFSMPERGLCGGLYRFYFQSVLPRLGNLVSSGLGRIERPYSYLPSSVEKFPGCAEFAGWMEEAGFRNVRYARWTGGVVALHEGEKAAP